MLSEAATTLARTLIARGQPLDGGLVQVPLSVREIAQLSGRSPGTVQSLLRQLDAHRVRVDARRRLFDPQALVDPAPAPRGTDPERQSSVRALSALVQLVDSSPEQLEAAVAIAADVLSQVARRSRAALPEDARQAREPSATARDAKRASFDREEPEVREEGSENRGLTSSNHSLSPPPRDRPVAARQSRASVTASRERDAVSNLVEPLVRACARLGLPGVTNSALLRARLEPYSDEQIRYAISRLLLEANTGALRSPVGKLAALAERADPDYFLDDPPAVTLPGESRVTPSSAPPPPLERAVVSQSLLAARASLRNP